MKHEIIKLIVRDNGGATKDRYNVVAADGCVYRCWPTPHPIEGFGQMINSTRNPVKEIKGMKANGPIVALDTLPAPVQDYLREVGQSTRERFPRCFAMLPALPLKHADIDTRQKQMLNELLAHGLVTRTKTLWKLK